MQVVLTYLQPLQHNSLLKCVSQPLIAKNSLKSDFRGSKSFKDIDVDSHKKLITIACYDKQSMSMHICNRFYARHANSGRIRTF